MGDFGTFKSGRQFASWVGFTPRQVSTGGKTQQLGISKRGNSYLRTLLVAGARAVIAKSQKTSWMQNLRQRRHCNVVVVALANKIARTVWAVLAKGAVFDLVKWNPIEPVKSLYIDIHVIPAGQAQQFNRFEGEYAKSAMMERRSNRVGGNRMNRQHLECIPEVGTLAANSHYGQQHQLQIQPGCKAANLPNRQDAKTCFPRTDHVGDSDI